MKQWICVSALIAIVFLCGCEEMKHKQIAELKIGQHAYHFEKTIEKKIGYLLFLPEDYGKTDKQWPLIIYLIGAGHRGNDLELVKVYGPARVAESRPDFPFVVLSPQIPEGDWFSNHVNTVIDLLDHVVDNYDVDESRVYMTGLSMGGYGTWEIASKYPERFAAIAPICGGGNPETACNLKYMPTWAFHGDKDSVVDIGQSQRMIDAIKNCGGDPKFTIYPGVNHGSWINAYEDDKIFDWFLQFTNERNEVEK